MLQQCIITKTFELRKNKMHTQTEELQYKASTFTHKFKAIMKTQKVCSRNILKGSPSQKKAIDLSGRWNPCHVSIVQRKKAFEEVLIQILVIKKISHTLRMLNNYLTPSPSQH